MKDQKELGKGDFRAIPNGIGSIEHRVDLLYQGVVDGRITPGALGRADLDHAGPDVRALRHARASSSPAPTPTSSSTTPTATPPSATSKTHHMAMDHSAWEGFEIDGHVDVVVSRGTVLVAGRRVPRPGQGHGQYLKRGLTQYLT